MAKKIVTSNDWLPCAEEGRAEAARHVPKIVQGSHPLSKKLRKMRAFGQPTRLCETRVSMCVCVSF